MARPVSNRVSHPVLWFIGVAAVIVSGIQANFQYFTYWSFQVFTANTLLTAAGLARPQFSWFAAFNAVFVMIGVFTMSILRSPDGSDMLTQAAASEGLLLYTVGTFGVHYLPVCVALSVVPIPTNDDREGIEAALLNAISLFVVYCSFNDPSEVYGVPITPAIAFTTSIGFSIAVLAVLWATGYR